MGDEASLEGSPAWRLGSEDLADLIRPAKPCPFCGCPDAFFFVYTYSKSFAVTCRGCGAQGPRRRSPGKALRLWESRC